MLVAAGLPSAHGKGGKNSAEQTLLQMEQDWSQADIKKDADTLYRFLAEDWICIDFEGTILNKTQALQGIASGSGSLRSTVLREIKVRVYGNAAIVTGTDTEKGQFHGRDSSGKYLWTDVFAHRNGRWQAVSSQSTKLNAPERPNLLARLHEIR